MSEILTLQPECIWRNFHLLTQVPRPSGHLEKVQQALLDFAAKAGVEAFIDPAGNVVMKKPATPGMENRKGVILQAHMDMVPQKTPASNHDFVNDPIVTRIEGDWLYATDTTLGADNGMGVAAIMAVMEDKTLVHGPINALITADEETSMVGANALPEGELEGEILLNLDTEDEGEMIIGSAGGVDVTAIIANVDARLATWEGGNMRNAIPRTCAAVFTVPAENVEELKSIVAEYAETFAQEYKGIEKSITVTAEDVETPATQIPQEIQDNVVNAINACHNAVLRYIPSIPDIVETSSNLAIVNIGGGKASVKILARSASESQKECIANMLESCFCMAGMKVTLSGDYQGWDPNPDSEMIRVMSGIYSREFGKEPKVNVVHAGLECSVILSKYPGLDIVSFGPTLRHPHTPQECCQISTVDKFWHLLKCTLAEVPEK